MKKALFILLVLSSFTLLSARTGFTEGIPPQTFSLSPFLGGYFFHTTDDVKDGPTAGLGFGYNYNKNLAAEFGLHYIDSESKGDRGGDASAWLQHMDAIYHFTPDQQLVPYVAGGLGSISINRNHGKDYTDFLVNWGGGLKYFVMDNLAIRADVRHVIPFDDVRSNLMINGGVTFFFGKKSVTAVLERAATPKPAPAPAPAPMDSDGDGVLDKNDKCPGTPAGAKVDEVGCTLKIEKPVRIELKVLFDTDQAVVKDEYSSELRKVADFMTSYPDTKAVIEGHTDNQGPSDYNRKLSQSRAAAVMQYLVQKLGVSSKRLSAIGYGETRPIASNDTGEGRSQNRRVVAEITGTVVE